jgi:protein arginine kinase
MIDLAADDLKNNIIISSRIRLARNYKDYLYSPKISIDKASEVIDKTLDAVKNLSIGKSLSYIDIEKQDDIQNRLLQERHLISSVFLKSKLPRALLLSRDENISIMINEEDHLRIQAIFKGNDIDEAFKLANHIDDHIEESMEYDFDKDLGYLTACPTNAGTGLRASYMIHIPMLEKSGQLKSLIQSINKFGITLRGTYGEGSAPLGSIYQISNQITLGKSEEDIMVLLKNVTNQIIDRELDVIGKTFKSKKGELIDIFYRAYGILRYCNRIDINEAMSLLSDVRLGFMTKLLDEPKPRIDIYDIMMNIQRGNLIVKAGRILDDTEKDFYRAEYINDVFRMANK